MCASSTHTRTSFREGSLLPPPVCVEQVREKPLASAHEGCLGGAFLGCSQEPCTVSCHHSALSKAQRANGQGQRRAGQRGRTGYLGCCRCCCRLPFLSLCSSPLVTNNKNGNEVRAEKNVRGVRCCPRASKPQGQAARLLMARLLAETPEGLTSPAGPDHEGRLPSGRVDEAIVMDESWVEGNAISVQRDRGELEV